MTIRVQITQYLPAPLYKTFETNEVVKIQEGSLVAIVKGEKLSVNGISVRYQRDGTLLFGEESPDDVS